MVFGIRSSGIFVRLFALEPTVFSLKGIGRQGYFVVLTIQARPVQIAPFIVETGNTLQNNVPVVVTLMQRREPRGDRALRRSNLYR